MEKTKRKKSWFKNQVAKVKILPWYWKLVATVLLAVAGIASALQLFTSSCDAGIIAAIIVAVVVLWFLIQMWIPSSEDK